MSGDKNFDFKVSDRSFGSLEEEINYYKNAIKHYSEFENVKMTCEMFFKLGHAYENKKEFKKAKNSYHISQKLYNEENDNKGEARSLEALGDLATSYKDFTTAISYYKLSEKKYHVSGNKKKEIEVLEKIAADYTSDGSYDDAQRYYKRAVSLGADDHAKNLLKKLQNRIDNLKPSNLQIFFLAGFILVLILSEFITTFYSKQVGLFINGIILIGLIIGSGLSTSNFSNLLRAMILLPLIRIIGLSLPIMQTNELYWFPLVAIPLFAAIYILIRSQKMTRESVGLVKGDLKIQIPVIFSGVIFGIIEYIILRPEPLIANLTIFSALFAGIILLISTGFAEELVFRGILQKNAENVMGNYWAILFASVLFTILHMGWTSFLDLIFVFLVAVFYGFVFQRTRSIMGISFSHGFTNILLFVLMPFLL